MIKRILQVIVLMVFVVFVGIQFIRPDFTNPPVVQTETLEASTQIPENVQRILTNSCADCHSNQTKYPWYSYIQPSANFLAGHIKEGRRELNFSVFNTYDARRKSRKLEEMCEQVQYKEMPLPSYLWIHRSAKLSDEEIKVLCDWTEVERARLSQNPSAAN